MYQYNLQCILYICPKDWTPFDVMNISDVVIHDFVILKIVPCKLGFTKFQLNLPTIQCFELSKSFIMDQFVTYRKRVHTECGKRLRMFREFFQGGRRRVWVVCKRWLRSEAVTPIINIYIGVGVNVVGSTR